MRTLKPEFWNSPSTAQADLAVRLTFMAMWNWADDSGHGTANLKELEAFCWPNDDIRDLPRERSGHRAGNSGDSAGTPAHGWRNFAEILGEVAEVYGVVFYRVAGRPYYEITNFKRHQAKDYRDKSRYPLPDEGEIYDVTSGNALGQESRPTTHAGTSGDMRGNSGHSAGTSGGGAGKYPPVIGEQGNRGTGEQGNSSARERAHAGAHERDDAPALVHEDGSPTPAGIVHEWERASGAPLTDSTRTAMRLTVSQCLRAGHHPTTIAQGIADWANSKITATSQIPSFVDRAAVRPRLTTNHDTWTAIADAADAEEAQWTAN